MPAKFTALVHSRETLLELAFSDIPSSIGELKLRPLSAGSFTLLGRLGNPMMVGSQAPIDAAQDSQTAMFAAAIQYLWVHSADLEKVLAVETAADIPATELKALGYQISIGQALGFLDRYQASALRMTASLAEIDPEDDEQGQPGKPESLPAGWPVSSTPAEAAEIPSASATSFGPCPSSEPARIFTPPTSQTAPVAGGPSLTLLPDLAGMATEEIPPN